eukprot:CAMPEP_0202860928 /NCGR_PEP_ID=MMETSP1391-20130828/2491_1 /ASSEMBLY_ACC=CAM_ASM_000867 /TAXON_ID=1034604 /ORGANISM="Chlamydomonas leiostraca, Strain SAG 11-49" /LENGTH=313 /DNA_ID=CAMNT_0049540217 /DNA_START=279 /DNA_END=1220 /DNA_ORIENTATION=-
MATTSTLSNTTDGMFMKLLRVTRLFNPGIRIIVVVNSHALTLQKEMIELAQLHIDVRLLEASPRANRLRRESRRSGSNMHRARFVHERFCAYADVAIREGITRALTYDGDMMIATNIEDYLLHHTSDVVTICGWTSQFVMWNDIHALDGYCRSMENLWLMNQTVLNEFRPTWLPETFPLSDMELLNLYLTRGLHGFTVEYMCRMYRHIPGTSTFQMCCPYYYDVPLLSIVTLHAVDNGTLCLNDTIDTSLRFAVDNLQRPVPIHAHTNKRLPILHFQGHACKPLVAKVYARHYSMLDRSREFTTHDELQSVVI